MKIAFDPETGAIAIADAGRYYATLKSIGTLKWVKQRQTLEGTADLETLNRIAALVRLPENVETYRRRLKAVQDAIDAERNKKNPEPATKPPVKATLYAHQVRAYNMALLRFGLIKPEEVMQYDDRNKPYDTK